MMPDLTTIGVVVPAHNEEASLAGCLTALNAAARFVSLPVRILVVLDDCNDRTVEVCQAFGVETRQIAAHNVGKARAAGFQALLERQSSPSSIWLASTDADTRVQPGWLRRQVALAQAGVDAVLGVVHLGDGVPAGRLRRQFEASYQKRLAPDGTHGHVHGANLGLRANVYLHAGGFPPLANHEDHALVQALRSLGRIRIAACQRVTVRTSGRIDGRCDEGFAASLQRLASADRTPLRPAASRRTELDGGISLDTSGLATRSTLRFSGDRSLHIAEISPTVVSWDRRWPREARA
jgi:glycosyltransferase involved in cell wall biosynthesis